MVEGKEAIFFREMLQRPLLWRWLVMRWWHVMCEGMGLVGAEKD